LDLDPGVTNWWRGIDEIARLSVRQKSTNDTCFDIPVDDASQN
jgi:hypothetical protein